MHLSIGKKIAFGFTFALLALLTIGSVLDRDLVDLNFDSSWVLHTVQVKQEISSLITGLLQAESTARGYQLSPDPSFPETFKNATIGINRNFRNLRTLTSDNPVQQVRLDKLEPLLQQRLDDLRRLMTLSPAEAAGQRNGLVTNGRQAMDEIEQLLTDMGGEEERLLKVRQDRSSFTAEVTSATIIYGTLLAFLLVGAAAVVITRSITYPLQVLSEGAKRLGSGDYSHRVIVKSKDEVGTLATSFNRMAEQVEHRQSTLAEQDWLKSSLARFGALFQGQRDPDLLGEALLTELATLLDAPHAVFYVRDRETSEPGLRLQASYACENPAPRLRPGEGLIGQCFVDKTRLMLKEVPADYLHIASGLGKAAPEAIVVQPAIFNDEVKAVIELAAFHPFSSIQLDFLARLAESTGIVLNTIEGAQRTEQLLRQSEVLSENLQAQQLELTATNQELEAQAGRLRTSEMQLQEQQEELKQTNEELENANQEMQQTNEEMEEKVNLLAEQKKVMEQANQEIERAREALEEQARQLTLASKYKSDFLSNMSHELRTPLNSLLILSQLLAANTEANLTEKQVQYAKTIHSSGNDLLELINEILDLSKIESGAVEIEAADFAFTELREFVENTFRPVAETKRVQFLTEVDPGLTSINTDSRRLEQVLKNLLSNAFKFTEKGAVTLMVRPATAGWNAGCETLNAAGSVIAFDVQDTGIGIPAEKQQIIFEAFQQADAGTSRKYGGTGLGLSISREIAALLGGSLEVTSVPGQGSTFTLYLPAVLPAGSRKSALPAVPFRAARTLRNAPSSPDGAAPEFEAIEPAADGLEDDRANLQEGDLTLLIIEDDRGFAGILMDFAREKKFKVVVARTVEQGLALATKIHPTAITLDLHLPDNDGWVVLDQLKHDPRTRHIPIHIISVDEERERSLKLGAVSYFQKPVTKEILEEALNQTIDFINRPLKNLLIIEDDAVQRQSLVDLIGNGDVHTEAVGTAVETFAALEAGRFDCIVLDLGLPDMNGMELIREIHRRYGPHAPPIIVYTGRELSRKEETELRMISDSIVIKNVRSPERLLDETALFLHRVQTKLPEPKRRMIEQVQKNESILSGRKVLVVDDDVRNIFAITSALESAQMQVSYAESGQAAIDLLQSTPGIEVVLMDVMMPEMDGFEAIRRIRALDKFKKLPIISVTAKAMKGDREKCLEAGASDYITKPVDMDQLRSLLRVWLYK